MSKILTPELSDRLWSAIEQQALQMRLPPECLVTVLLDKHFSQNNKSLLTEAEKEAARTKFEEHFGSLDLGGASNIDNESIDRDLNKEYVAPHACIDYSLTAEQEYKHSSSYCI